MDPECSSGLTLTREGASRLPGKGMLMRCGRCGGCGVNRWLVMGDRLTKSAFVTLLTGRNATR